MKQIKLLLLLAPTLIFFSVSLNAQLDSLDCTGALGDVKWSILDPEKFQEVNGDCWTLMDGQSLPADTKLKAMGFDKIPNGQGVFLRAIDMRTTGRLDPDRPRGTKPGDYQGENFKAHNHDLSNEIWVHHRSFVGSADADKTLKDRQTGSGDTKFSQKTEDRGGNETRPKNIALYLFIRIN